MPKIKKVRIARYAVDFIGGKLLQIYDRERQKYLFEKEITTDELLEGYPISFNNVEFEMVIWEERQCS